MRGDMGAAAVIIVLAAAMLGVTLWLSENPEPQPTPVGSEMQYDDYILMNDCDSARGSLDLQFIGGKRYLHAADLGEGSYYRSGAWHTVNVVPAKLEIVLVMGQSNMAYYKPMSPAGVNEVPAIGTAYYYGSPTRPPNEVVFDEETYDGIYDMINSQGELKFGDKGPSYCAWMNRATGHKMLWVSLGVPGKAISEWDADGRLWIHDKAMMDATLDALAAYGDRFEVVEVYGWWGQGGHDWLYNKGRTQYMERFDELHSRWMAGDLGVTPSAIYMMPTRESNGGWVTEAQMEIVETYDDVYDATGPLVGTFSIDNGLMWSEDGIHFTQKADNIVSARYAWYILTQRGIEAPMDQIYLVEKFVDADLGESLTIPATATAYRLDGTTETVAVSWPSGTAMDTSAYGKTLIEGSTAAAMLAMAPAPLMTLYTGYLGWEGQYEYAQTGASTCGIIDRSAEITAMAIPSEAFSLDVTSVEDWGCYRGPWTSVEIPDSIVSLGAHAFGECPKTRTLTVGSGLESVEATAIEWTMRVDGENLDEDEWMADPGILEGTWTGTTDMLLIKQEASP